MFCDNEAVYKNASTPESTLEKKNVSICYHKCREDMATREAWVAKEWKSANSVALFTKMLVQIRQENLLKFSRIYLFEKWCCLNGEGVVLFPRKELPLPPYQGVARGCGFDVRFKSILRCISIAHPKNQVKTT